MKERVKSEALGASCKKSSGELFSLDSTEILETAPPLIPLQLSRALYIQVSINPAWFAQRTPWVPACGVLFLGHDLDGARMRLH
jgi:hypothetical protein